MVQNFSELFFNVTPIISPATKRKQHFKSPNLKIAYTKHRLFFRELIYLKSKYLNGHLRRQPLSVAVRSSPQNEQHVRKFDTKKEEEEKTYKYSHKKNA